MGPVKRSSNRLGNGGWTTLQDAAPVATLRIGAAAILIGGWQLLSGPFVDPFFISSPSEIAKKLWTWIIDNTLIYNLSLTLGEVVAGFVIGCVAGILIGLIFGSVRIVAVALGPFVTAFYALPKLALLPLFVLWFGIGITPKIAVVALATFFFLFFNTFSGVRTTSVLLRNSLLIMGATRSDLLRLLILPSAVTWIFAGIRIATPFALINAIVGEMFVGDRGIGYLVQFASGRYDSTGVFAALVVIMALASLLHVVIDRMEARVSRWREIGS